MFTPNHDSIWPAALEGTHRQDGPFGRKRFMERHVSVGNGILRAMTLLACWLAVPAGLAIAGPQDAAGSGNAEGSTTSTPAPAPPADSTSAPQRGTPAATVSTDRRSTSTLEVGVGDVSLDVQDRPLEEVVQALRERSGNTNIVVAPGIADAVTIHLVNVPWRRALDLVCRKAGCVVSDQGDGVLRVEKPPRVTFYFPDTDLRKVVDAIAKVSGANIIVAPEVQGTVNVRIADIPWRSALESIVKSAGFTLVEDDQEILRVISPKALVEELETRVFELKYIKPPETYVAQIQSDYAAGKVKAPSQDPEKDFTLLKALRRALTKEGKLDYIDRRNMIIVTDTRPVLDMMEKIIERIDVEPSQIFVDVKFVTTSNTDFFDFGVDIGDQGFQVSANGSSIPIRLPFVLGRGGFEDSIIASDTGTGPQGLDPAALASQVKFGTLDFTKATATLRLLKRDVTTKIVQAPKLLAIDNQPSTIVVGETVRFAQVQAEQGQAGGLRVGVEEADNSPVQVGFQLLVTPHVVPNTNKIIMECIPKEESLTGTSTEMPGFDVFKLGEGANQIALPLPRVASRTLVTKMVLESGQTAVIGGLLFEREAETENKLPFLGDIPILGWLFKSRSTSKLKENLIVFITPTIVKNSYDTRDLLKEDMRERTKALEEEFPEFFQIHRSKPFSYANQLIDDIHMERE
jgi:type IV pilus assembly protein PilQ